MAMLHAILIDICFLPSLWVRSLHRYYIRRRAFFFANGLNGMVLRLEWQILWSWFVI